MKKQLIYILVFVICLLFIIGGFFFLTKEKKDNNIITFGNLKMKIIETKLNVNNEEISVENNESLDVSYTPKVSRIIRIKNLGKEPIYVRISFKIIGIRKDDSTYSIDDEMIYVDSVSKKWVYKDGWYYYKYKLEKEDITKKLTTEINFNLKQLMKTYPNGRFDLKINAQAVQAKHNKKNVLEVKGWPSSK